MKTLLLNFLSVVCFYTCLFGNTQPTLEITHSKLESTLLGVAIGDAFGVGIEMRDRDWIIQNIDFSKYVSMRQGKHAEGYRLGDYSDDTSDTIAVTLALMDASAGISPFTEDKLLENIQLQYELSRVERGGVPRAGFGSLKDVFEGIRTLDEVRTFQAQRAYPGNAPPMRAIPIGFVSEDLINAYAIINADVSHPHPKARAASIIVARAARFLIVEEGSHELLIPYCLNHIRDIDSETYEYLCKIDKLGPSLSEEDFSFLVGPQPIPGFLPPRTGLGCDAMRTAGTMLYILKHSKSAFEGFCTAIRTGGDVDSLAALVTGIMGGRYGLEDMPPFLLDGLEGRDTIKNLADQFAESLKGEQ